MDSKAPIAIEGLAERGESVIEDEVETGDGGSRSRGGDWDTRRRFRESVIGANVYGECARW